MKLVMALKCLLPSICLFLAAPAVGQTNGCGELKITSPDYLEPREWRSLKATSGTGEPVTADWTLVKEN